MKHTILFKLCLMLSVVVLSACAPRVRKTAAQLDRMTPEELIQEFSSAGYDFEDNGNYHFGLLYRIEDMPQKEVFRACIRIMDDYDPTTRKGCSADKATRLYGAVYVLGSIDDSTVRVRGTTEGRQAVAAFQRMFDRCQAAHYDDPKNDGRRVLHSLFAPLLRQMLGRNLADSSIEIHLREWFRIHLTEEEKIRYFDFLLAKDPGYIAWFDKIYENVNLCDYTQLSPYYQAYLEFKETERQK